MGRAEQLSFSGEGEEEMKLANAAAAAASKFKSPQMPIGGPYRVIYADPPWSYGKSFDPAMISNGAAGHYPTMLTEDICGMTLPEIAKDAVLFLWATAPLLPESLQVINAWGFIYKTHFIWDKERHNVGHYSSVRHELLMVATRGNCTPDTSKLLPSVQRVRRNDNHSSKPEAFRNLILALYPIGPYVELFARTKTAGWDVYGNESSLS